MSERHSVFPTAPAGLSFGLEEAPPVMMDGMKVLFDEKVGLYPVDLEHNDGETSGDGPDDGTANGYPAAEYRRTEVRETRVTHETGPGADEPGGAGAGPAPFDEALVPFGDFISGLLAVAEPIDAPEVGVMTLVEELDFDLPVELEVARVAGTVVLAVAPPTQRTETSVNPVFHRLRVRVTLDPPETAEAGRETGAEAGRESGTGAENGKQTEGGDAGERP